MLIFFSFDILHIIIVIIACTFIDNSNSLYYRVPGKEIIVVIIAQTEIIIISSAKINHVL